MDDAIFFEELQRCFKSERVMWSNAIIDILPMSELFVEIGDSPGAVVDLVKLLCMGPICSFHGAV